MPNGGGGIPHGDAQQNHLQRWRADLQRFLSRWSSRDTRRKLLRRSPRSL